MKKYIFLFIASFLVTNLAHSQLDRSKQPAPGPAPKVNLTEPNTFKLNNGLTVMVVENHKLPTVRIQLLIDNPPHASGSKVGVESIFSMMMGNGTTSISKDDFNEEVDYLGATISFGEESAYATSLSEYFPRIMELMADAIKNPLLTEEEFQKDKDKFIEGLRSQERNVSAVSSVLRDALVFGKNHPMGEFPTIKSVEGITLNDVKKFYTDYFNPKNAYLVVVGDVKSDKVEAIVRQHLGDWENRNVPSVKYSDPKDVQYAQINFIDMPNAVQSEIGALHLINLKMSDPDYFPVLIANRILGGGFNSLLNMNLREAHGWTYGAFSQTGADKYITRFLAATSVRNAVTDSAVVEMLKEFNYIRDNKITSQQLTNAKAKFTGDFVLALERAETVANYALRIKTQNLPNDFYVNYLKKINAVTAEDVQRVAKKYYKPEKLRIVVVGKGSEVLEGLKNIKGPNGKPLPVLYFDREGNPVQEPNYNVKVEGGVTAETVLNKYLEAIGGRKAAENVKSMRIKANAEMQGMKLDFMSLNTSKGQSLTEVSMGGMVLQKAVFDGEKGYMMAQGQKVENTEEQNAEAKIASQPFKELNAPNAKLVRAEQVNGKDTYVISFGDKDSEYFYDKESGLLVQQSNTVEAMGQTIVSTVVYEDYKTVDGIKVPHSIKQSAGPQELTFKVNEVLINEDVPADAFK